MVFGPERVVRINRRVCMLKIHKVNKLQILKAKGLGSIRVDAADVDITEPLNVAVNPFGRLLEISEQGQWAPEECASTSKTEQDGENEDTLGGTIENNTYHALTALFSSSL